LREKSRLYAERAIRRVYGATDQDTLQAAVGLVDAARDIDPVLLAEIVRPGRVVRRWDDPAVRRRHGDVAL
jgi:hypothetical protein